MSLIDGSETKILKRREQNGERNAEKKEKMEKKAEKMNNETLMREIVQNCVFRVL
jgi:hypothetical protein